MSQPEIVLHDEVQIADWGESRAGGPWIKLRLSDPDLLDQFRGMDTATLKKTGHILHCTLAEGDIARLVENDQGDQKPNHGKFWQRLIASGFFRAPQVCAALGPERAFEGWIRRQPSVLDGAQDWDEEQGEGRCEVAHVRKVSEGAGTAEKPPYFAVPLTHEQHEFQHKHGYAAVLGINKTVTEGVPALDWFTKKADQYRTEWASILLARTLDPDVTSRSQVSPDQVREWVRAHDLEQYFPKDLRDNTGE